jgi:hypothetical protein
LRARSWFRADGDGCGAGGRRARGVGQVRDLVAYIHQNRDDAADRPFEIVLGGVSPGDSAKVRDLLGPLVEAGATWWDERQLQSSDEIDRLAPVMRRIEHGPPAL